MRDLNIFEMWVAQFSQWPPLGQALFILIILGGLSSFITVLVRGYPEYFKKDG